MKPAGIIVFETEARVVGEIDAKQVRDRDEMFAPELHGLLDAGLVMRAQERRPVHGVAKDDRARAYEAERPDLRPVQYGD